VADLKRDAAEMAETLVGWRRELHQWPELGFEEERTARFVADRLADTAFEVRTGVAGTGVVALLRAAKKDRPGILLRADMDGLPVQEVAGRAYGSQVAGRMHACGHDGHMAMLLGAARLLSKHKDSLARDVVLCFQPAEEGRGGAQAMIAAGVLGLVDLSEAFAIHLWSEFPAGTFHVRPGPIMAAQDEFEVRVVGRAGHAALPHKARDPIVAAAHAVTALQSVVARSVDPVEPAVVTVGIFQAGSAANVIPEDAYLRGTLRSFAPAVREVLRTRVRETVEHAAAAAGCRAELTLHPGYPAVVNDAAAAEAVRAAAADVAGHAAVFLAAPMAAAEDFAYFLEKVPGAFLFLGAGNVARGITAPHHSPAFDLDESVLPLGAALLTRLALG